ncbi:hypothetical protein EMGBS6_14530 [Opitutia bacterium]|nr:hypothetical protein EMGBS6_14530 [Opitutae bacterium]
MHRRHFLGTSLLAGLATQAFGATKEEDSFDFAFLTDIHVQPELGAPKAFANACGPSTPSARRRISSSQAAT